MICTFLEIWNDEAAAPHETNRLETSQTSLKISTRVSRTVVGPSAASLLTLRCYNICCWLIIIVKAADNRLNRFLRINIQSFTLSCADLRDMTHLKMSKNINTVTGVQIILKKTLKLYKFCSYKCLFLWFMSGFMGIFVRWTSEMIISSIRGSENVSHVSDLAGRWRRRTINLSGQSTITHIKLSLTSLLQSDSQKRTSWVIKTEFYRR